MLTNLRTCQSSCFQDKKPLKNSVCQKRGVVNRVQIVRCSDIQQQQEQQQPKQEKFINVDEVLSEVSGMVGSDFVFEDNDVDEPVWEYEREPSETANSSDSSSELPFMLKPDKIPDILSAYDQESGFQEISVADLRSKQSDFDLILDIRHSSDFKAGHIEGAKNIPFDALSMSVRNGDLDEFKKGQIAVVCGFGNSSSQATVKLSKVFGFENVVNVFGGMEQWITSEFEVVRET
eukprot:TRINITY_DN11851_c0_g1_i5.p1 TRINITY_DN11851_c0_g1~~TRINITY_DN11851_c0_g1_i5.p1  ORF type:complete len:234 (+),score=37.57 TRINITY_DN11851_c0_g1_i5:122-823(+)